MFRAAFTSAWQAYPQAVHQKTAWLSRDFGSTCPHAEHRWLVNAGLIFSTRPGALSCRRRISRPQPDRRIPRLSPAFCRTLRPGFSRVPFADRGHIWDLEVFDPDQVESACDVGAGLLHPVPTPVCLPGLQSGQCQPHPPAALRAPLSAGEPTLQPPHPGPLPPGQARDAQQFPGRQSCGDRDAPVDAHGLAVTGCGNRRGDGGERDMPSPGPVHRHPVRSHACGDGARPAEPDPPGLRYPDLTGVPAESAQLPGSDGNDPESLVPTGLAPRRPPGRVRRVEERSHRLGEIPQGLLLHHLGTGPQPRVLGAGGGELSALLQVARRTHTARPPVRVLLDSEVPHVPGMDAVVPQHCLLGGRGDQPVTGHANTLANAADISEVTRQDVRHEYCWTGNRNSPPPARRISTTATSTTSVGPPAPTASTASRKMRSRPP
jgi:hypothetical protein